MPQSLESDALWREAGGALPLPRLAALLGDTWQRGADPCPACKKKNKFKIFEYGHRWFFNCFNPECDLHAPDGPKDEIGYLACRRGLARKQAALEYLRLAVPHRLAENQPAAPEEPAPSSDRRSEAETMESANAHHAVWKRLALTDADAARLQNKRGFSREIIDLCGLRSNNEGNRERLESLREEYAVEHLITEGIYKHERFKEPRLAGQLVGWGRTGRKDPKGDEIWDVTEPPLIPYFNAEGIPFYLRPHKGGLKKPEDPFADVSFDETDIEEDDEERPCASYVYVPPGTAHLVAENDGMCILTEGEFKAIACRQARVPCIATPGTSFLKNALFRRRLVAALEELGVTHLVIIYDNEVKDDPTLATFKEDPHDRYDVQVWAEYAHIILAPHLARAGGSSRIGWLPEEFRVDGKADFDSILGKLVSQHGVEQGTARARKLFLKTVADSRAPGQFLDLFADTAQRIIQWKVKQKRHKWKLLTGGKKEIEKAIKFGEFDGDHPIDRELSTAFREVHGCYYSRKSVAKEERGKLIKLLKELAERIEEAKGTVKDPTDARIRTLLVKREALYERLRGIPEQVSTFTLRCEYRLHGHDSHVIRLVRILDSKDLKAKYPKLYRLTGSDLAGLRNFREWLLNTGGGTWHGGEKDLQCLTEDLDHQAYMRDIHEIVRIGYDKESKIWFMGDCGKGPGGETIIPDDKGIYWHEGFGYQIEADADERGATSFIQGLPYLLKPHGGVKPLAANELDARGGVRGIFQTLAQDLFDNIGGYDAWLGLGLVLGYGIAPELLKMDGEGHPAPWVFGKLGEGKSTTMNWLMRIWGFRSLEGILLNSNLTENALQRILGTYSCLPVFLDEARRETLTDTKLAILRGCYQRQFPAKAIADYSLKVRGVQPHTTPMVGGESSSHDGATRSRFGHLNVAANRRIGDALARKARMTEEAAHYYRIGEWLLSNRPKFVEAALYYLDAWVNSESVKEHISHDRVRFVHGVAYACMQAACSLLGIHEASGQQFTASPESATTDHRPRTMTEFNRFLLTYGEQALRDVRDETFVNKFWDDLRQGLVRKKFSAKSFFTAHITTSQGRVSIKRAAFASPPPAGATLALLITIKDVFPAYEESYRQRTGTAPPLSMGDIRRSLEREPYWIPPEKGRSFHRPKSELSTERIDCWAFSLASEPDPENVGDPIYLFPAAEGLLAALSTDAD